MTDLHLLTWDDAIREFQIHLQANRAAKTARFYKVQLGQLRQWAEANDVGLNQFGKRHLDRYLIARAQTGKAQLTLHHDAVAVKAFFRWCAKNEVLERSPLAEYEVRKAPAPARYMPTDEDVQRLLKGIGSYWSPAENPPIRYYSLPKRIFHRERDYAIALGLLDSAARIGEMLHLKLDDYQPQSRLIVIRESKGREPRVLPVSPEWASTLSIWLKQRDKVLRDAPQGTDDGWLFITETGNCLNESNYGKTLKDVCRTFGITEKITLHSLRRYSLNRLAKHNLLAAQTIAGHKETKTTILYTKLDPDFVRDMHAQVGVVRSVLQSRKEAIKRKRLV